MCSMNGTGVLTWLAPIVVREDVKVLEEFSPKGVFVDYMSRPWKGWIRGDENIWP
ncbi:MAG: hypothetical protein ACJAZ9_001282 [Neolewinella sp.]|jgi:hypothetical protein